MLYLVATPIGNLKDITFRALEVLKECDYILCEDTRHSSILLTHYQIEKPLRSYHKFNESSSEQKIIHDLLNGNKIALISDAGTPGISDPGEKLVKACIENDISVSSIPGPCALIAAISCSGLLTDRFQFCGFLPKKSQALQEILSEVLQYKGTSVCYESPNRVIHLLEVLSQLAPQRQIVLARELTKKFEQIDRGNALNLYQKWQTLEPKGEFVLVISPNEDTYDWSSLSVNEHVEKLMLDFNLTKKEAIKTVSELRHVPKKAIYKETLSLD